MPARMREMERAIRQRDFETFGTLTMRESNSFHATCLDTEPPIFYLNDVSRAAIRAVETINAAAGGRVVAAYTFDAGPNAVVYFEEGRTEEVAGWFKGCLGEKEGWGLEWGPEVEAVQGLGGGVVDVLRGGVGRVILTGVGEGPVVVGEHLIDEEGEVVE